MPETSPSTREQQMAKYPGILNAILIGAEAAESRIIEAIRDVSKTK